eukprot:191155-Amphidinium_carterae.1
MGAIVEVQQLPTSRPMFGIGGGSPVAKERARIHLAFPATDNYGKTKLLPLVFEADVIDQQAVPALLGLTSLTFMKGKVDPETRRLHFVQDKTSYFIELVPADSGHLMVPIVADE